LVRDPLFRILKEHGVLRIGDKEVQSLWKIFGVNSPSKA
jgi:hypothetical protein